MLDTGISVRIFDILREYFQRYGYWTVGFALLLENMGLPVPGETTLLFASFLASTEHQLHLPFIVVFGILAASAGDNAGYAIGRFGGRRLIDKYLRALHVGPARVEKGERFFARHGAVTIYSARFIAGLRIVAGPIAGLLRMRWKKFMLFNFLGAVSWVSVVAWVGYFFGGHFDDLLRIMSKVNLVLIGLAIAAVTLWWWHRRMSRTAS